MTNLKITSQILFLEGVDIMANKILHTTIMRKNTDGDKLTIYPKTVTKNIIDGSSTLDQTLNTLKSPNVSNKTVTFTEASIRENIVSGETLAISQGKIKKLISDLKSLAYLDQVGVSNLDSSLTTAYNNRVTTDKVTTSTTITSDGYVADARAVNDLQNQINSLNSTKVSKTDEIMARKEWNSSGLNQFNVDTTRGSWYTPNSDRANTDYGTMPDSNDWHNIVQFDTTHFVSQLGMNINSNSNAIPYLHVRTRYMTSTFTRWYRLMMDTGQAYGSISYNTSKLREYGTPSYLKYSQLVFIQAVFKLEYSLSVGDYVFTAPFPIKSMNNIGGYSHNGTEFSLSVGSDGCTLSTLRSLSAGDVMNLHITYLTDISNVTY